MRVTETTEAAGLTSGQTVSLWMATSDLPMPQTLSDDERADVCVIGGGIAGLTTAYCLLREGKSVILLDDGPLCGGETCRTTAHLSNEIDDRYTHIGRIHGQQKAALAAGSHRSAIDFIEQTIAAEHIDCDFARLDGYLFSPPDESPEMLASELEAARQAGVDVEMVPRAPMAGFDTGPCLRFPRQAQFHPLNYLLALSQRVRQRGGLIFRAHARQIQGGKSASVNTREGYHVRADHIVVATNTPVNDLVAIHTKQAAYRTYAIGITVPRGSVAPALYWDTLDPYHYVRVAPLQGAKFDGMDMLIVGGEDHKTGQADDAAQRWESLELWGREHFPMGQNVEFRWSGQVMETIDGLAFIGPNPGDAGNVWLATGDSGMGMTHGTIAGLLLSDLIVGRHNEWAQVYDP